MCKFLGSFFTSEQWLEFTQQTYIFKHFTAGVAPPAALLLPIINTLALATMMQNHTSPFNPSFNLFGGISNLTQKHKKEEEEEEEEEAKSS